MRALLWTGLALLVVGTGPLLAIIVLSSLGIGYPNPNPVGLGLLAFFTFWPAMGMTAVGGIARILGRRTPP